MSEGHGPREMTYVDMLIAKAKAGAGLSQQPSVETVEMYSEEGRERGTRPSIRKVRMIELAESEVQEAKAPPKYYNGAWRYLPRSDVKLAMKIAIDRGWNQIEPICLTCQCALSPLEVPSATPGQPAIKLTSRVLFGCVNDHLRVNVNHLVVMRNLRDGLLVYRSDYDILGTVQ